MSFVSTNASSLTWGMRSKLILSILEAKFLLILSSDILGGGKYCGIQLEVSFTSENFFLTVELSVVEDFIGLGIARLTLL